MIPIELVHPMLVHFPLVLLPIAVVLDVIVLTRGGDLTGGQALSRVALGALLLGTLFAAAAAFFGDIALDLARDRGFAQVPLERHQETALTALWIFLAYGAFRLMAWWRGWSLAGARGWLSSALAVVGVGVLVGAAHFGGELVYQLGVNVAQGTN
jgi:uncharacterized membrane protein